ncbi:hypothetical protein MMC34_008780 [Xylographa carneopallida]|nr:hypothetical protein [Xylographa carneopallida]
MELGQFGKVITPRGGAANVAAASALAAATAAAAAGRDSTSLSSGGSGGGGGRSSVQPMASFANGGLPESDWAARQSSDGVSVGSRPSIASSIGIYDVRATSGGTFGEELADAIKAAEAGSSSVAGDCVFVHD